MAWEWGWTAEKANHFMAQCKHCGEPLIWRKVDGYGWMPFDQDGVGHMRMCARKVQPKRLELADPKKLVGARPTGKKRIMWQGKRSPQ